MGTPAFPKGQQHPLQGTSLRGEGPRGPDLPRVSGGVSYGPGRYSLAARNLLSPPTDKGRNCNPAGLGTVNGLEEHKNKKTLQGLECLGGGVGGRRAVGGGSGDGKFAKFCKNVKIFTPGQYGNIIPSKLFGFQLKPPPFTFSSHAMGGFFPRCHGNTSMTLPGETKESCLAACF